MINDNEACFIPLSRITSYRTLSLNPGSVFERVAFTVILYHKNGAKQGILRLREDRRQGARKMEERRDRIPALTGMKKRKQDTSLVLQYGTGFAYMGRKETQAGSLRHQDFTRNILFSR
jgi:hypothetical protein